MKFYTLILLVLLVNLSYAQDTIVKNNNDTLSVSIKEINENQIIFSYINETLTNKLAISAVKEIRFSSGRIQKFSNLEATLPYSFDIEEPKYIGNIIQLSPKGEIINTLEQQKASSKTSANASTYIIGIGKATTKSMVNLPKSPIRVDTGKVIFIVRVNDINTTPKEIFNIFKLDQNNKKRLD